MINSELSKEQAQALEFMRSGENIFLTGGAGTGKSYLVREFQKELDRDLFPTLASTGAAAVLLGGRTFHSFFGLGIMDGGTDATFERCMRDKKLTKRLKKVEGIIIDEISMIPGDALMISEALAQKARGSSLPWGGIRVIAVGDFCQLPPVSRDNRKDWAFANPVWNQTGFRICYLTQSMRAQDPYFAQILNQIRLGKLSEEACELLNRRVCEWEEVSNFPRLFPRRNQADIYNQKKLNEIDGELLEVETFYWGDERSLISMKKNLSCQKFCKLKKAARSVLCKTIRKNVGSMARLEQLWILTKNN